MRQLENTIMPIQAFSTDGTISWYQTIGNLTVVIGTITGVRRAMAVAQDAGWGTIVSARSGETEDTMIVHLATGWDAGQLKVGSFARSERMAKWNEALRIEEALGSAATYAGLGALPNGRRKTGG